MPHIALAIALDEDLIETVDAISAPLRNLSPHIAEMTHAQELSDVTLLCEFLWAEVQTSDETDRAPFQEYLERRRKVGFSTDELRAIVGMMGRVVGQRLDASSKNGDTTPADLEEGRKELAVAIATLDRTITETQTPE
jgi:hypothetical protein